MAKLELTLHGPFDEIADFIVQGVLDGSSTASLEEKSTFFGDGARCAVYVFERYSYLGGNRVSITVMLFQAEPSCVRLSAIATGGSQAMFIKMNTFGERSFLNKLDELLRRSRYIRPN